MRHKPFKKNYLTIPQQGERKLFLTTIKQHIKLIILFFEENGNFIKLLKVVNGNHGRTEEWQKHIMSKCGAEDRIT